MLKKFHILGQGNLLCWLLILGYCVLLAACSDENRGQPDKVSLLYSASANGQIMGAAEQQVASGESGQAVRAVADEGYHFVGWSDGLQTAERVDRGGNGDLQVTAEFALDAEFAFNQYPLIYTAAEHGSIVGPAQQKVAWGQDGEEVTAVAQDGYRFAGWSDGVATASRSDRGIKAALEVSAGFVKQRYPLEYRAAANGSISGEASQTVAHNEDGTAVEAVPAEHYHFTRWSDGGTTARRVDRKVQGPIRVTAEFAVKRYQLAYRANQHGTLSGAAQQQVAHGRDGREVTAVPDPGYHFTGWSDGVSSTARVDRAVTAPISVTAEFAVNRYPLSYRAAEHGSIEGELTQQIAHGEDAGPVVAVADPGYRFVGWSDGVATPRRIDSAVTGPLQVTAAFELITYRIGGRLEGLVEGTAVQLRNGGKESLSLSRNGAFSFSGELPPGSRYQVAVESQPRSPNQTCRVTSGSGTVTDKNVTDIVVACTLNRYSVGGSVRGLPAGDQVGLSINDRDPLILAANEPFAFPQRLEDGRDYRVRITTQLTRENWICELSHTDGTVAGGPVSDLLVDCYQQLQVQVVPGRGQVEPLWNAEDFPKVTFNLCLAGEEIPADGYARCAELAEGRIIPAIQPGQIVGELVNDQDYWFQLQADDPAGRETLSQVVKATPFGGLNDTGIDWCADTNRNYRIDSPRSQKEQSCQSLAPQIPGQDALYGRDAAARVRALPKTGSGSGGFDFVKYCRSGEAAGDQRCPANPRVGTGYDEWTCTLDKVTGLLWEIKSARGLRARGNSYTWYNPDAGVNNGNPGAQGSDCETEACNSEAYIEAVNAMGLCGYRDWRLPTRRELLSIVDNGRINPSIDTRYFPNTAADYYWTSSTYQDQPGMGWQVYFFYGEAITEEKSVARSVRLVRGQTVTFGRNNP